MEEAPQTMATGHSKTASLMGRAGNGGVRRKAVSADPGSAKALIEIYRWALNSTLAKI
jgi:hypothetical protein